MILFGYFFIPVSPVTGMKCSYGKISIPVIEISVVETDYDRDLGNRGGPPSHMNTSNFLQRKYSSEARSR